MCQQACTVTMWWYLMRLFLSFACQSRLAYRVNTTCSLWYITYIWTMSIWDIRVVDMLGVYGVYTSMSVSSRTSPIRLAPISMDSLLRYIPRDILIPMCIEVFTHRVGMVVCISTCVHTWVYAVGHVRHLYHGVLEVVGYSNILCSSISSIYVYEGCEYSIWVRCVSVRVTVGVWSAHTHTQWENIELSRKIIIYYIYE